MGGFAESAECHGGVIGVEQSVHGGTTGGHAGCKRGFGERLPLHRIADLQRDGPLQGPCIGRLKQSFLGKEGVERTAGVRILFLTHGREGIGFCV